MVITGVFMANSGTIKKNFNLFKSRISSPASTEETPVIADERPVEPEPQAPAPVVQEPAAQRPATQRPPSRPAVTAAEPRPQTPAPVPEMPAAQTPPPLPPEPQNPPPQIAPTPEAPRPLQIRDRTIYFTQIDKDGQILRSRVNRRIPVSDVPLQDSLDALLTGPTAEELNRGIINLIPANTRVLSASVRGNTAYISFSEDFTINTFGVEGYAAQLRQIVWTATEFPNVRDVQILIEGRRTDYLGEGIWIGSPINRQSF